MADPINAGELRHRITVQRSTQVLDDYGQYYDDVETLGTFWAKVTPLTGREAVNAKELKATTSHQIYMCVSIPIKPSYQLIFEGRKFGIDSIVRVGEINTWYSIMATELI